MPRWWHCGWVELRLGGVFVLVGVFLRCFLPCFFTCMRTWQSFVYWGVPSTQVQTIRRHNRHAGSASNRQAAYSFFQKQAVDRHTNAKTPEPELEPAMQAIMKTRQMPAQLLSWRVADTSRKQARSRGGGTGTRTGSE